MNTFRAATAAIAITAIQASAGTPSMFNYQGRLLDGTNLVNGATSIVVRLFDAPTAGNMIFEDSNDVLVADGIYSLVIGDILDTGNLASALTNAQLWLQVTVGSTDLVPREQVVSSPYAIRAQIAETASLQWTVATNTTLYPPEGQWLLVTNITEVTTVNLPQPLPVGFGLRTVGYNWRIPLTLHQRDYLFSINKLTLPDDAQKYWDSFAASSDGTRIAAAPFGTNIFISTNHGTSWTAVAHVANWSRLAGSASGFKLLAISQPAGDLFISLDGGSSWSPSLTSTFFASISADGTTMYAARSMLAGGLMQKSLTDGASWTVVNSNQQWRSIACSSDGLTVMASSIESNMIVSTDGGTTWSGAGLNFWGPIVLSANGQRALSAVSGNVILSYDGGTTWTNHFLGPGFQNLTASSDGQVLAAAGDGQLSISTDSGSNWLTTAFGSFDVRGCAISADADTLVVGAQFINISTNQGASWRRSFATEWDSLPGYISPTTNNVAFEFVGIGGDLILPLMTRPLFTY